VGGYLADIFGRRPLLMLAMLVYVFAGVAPFLMQSLVPILLCRIGVGLCEGVVLTVTTAMLGDYFKDRMREKVMGFQTAVASISASLLILFSGYLGKIIGWNGPFLIYGITVLWLAGIWLFTWEPVPDASAGETAGTVSWAGFPWARIIEICAVTLLGGFFFFTLQLEVPNFLPHFGVTDPGTIGMLSGFATWGMVAGAMLFQWVIKRPLGVLLAGELILIAVTFLVIGFAPNPTFLIGASFFNQIGCGMLLPTLLIASMRFLPFEHRGRGTGIWQGTFQSGQFVVGMSFPAITHAFGGAMAHSLLSVGVAAALAALIAVVMAIRSHGKLAPVAQHVPSTPAAHKFWRTTQNL
jgi:MFS family permease